ncbi:MAG: putative bifunctional diguanylate cyclase/phosphodiesterase [Hyphomicrobiales bacterium]
MEGKIHKPGHWRLLWIAAFAALCAVIGLSGWLYVQSATEQLLEEDAHLDARDWSGYLARNLRDLPAIARGETPSLHSISILEQAGQMGGLYLFRIYDPEGRLKLSSGDFYNRLSFNQPIERIDRRLAAALRHGEAATFLYGGEVVGDPEYFASTILPVKDGPRIAGWLAIHVDQSERRALFLATAAKVSLAMGILLSIAPLLGFWYRTRQINRAVRRIEHLERRDPVTGLANRVAFLKQIGERLAAIKNEGGSSAVIKFELSGLEAIDQSLGHEAANHAVATLARRLVTMLPENSTAARLDHWRLAVLVTGIADPFDILRLAKEITGELGEPVDWQGQRLSVRALAGIALAPVDGASAEELSRSARLALDHCREPGSPGYGFFNPQIVQASGRRLEVERALNDAVAAQSFRLEFQPVFKIKDGELSGFEALMRLEDPQLGPISPTEFIPAAERSGLISQLGAWCLEEACRIAAGWPAHLVVAVNLSPAQFYSGTLIANVHRALDLAKFPAYRLEVEITEGTLLRESDVVMEQLRILREMGVAVVMDDFGTGYSSLSYLWKFPFSKIKIDRAFVAALDTTASARGIMRSIVRMGRALGLSVTAEGIETSKQLTALRELGCEFAQGYLLGRPARVEDVAAIVLRNFAQSLPRRGRDPAADDESAPFLAAGGIPG